MISCDFFDRDPQDLAIALLGKVLRHRYRHPRRGLFWLSARIIETEAYYIDEKGSHSSQGFTEKRKAMFMAPGTIYMYYARGSDSLNFSARGEGNAVLIKSGYPLVDDASPDETLDIMAELNPGQVGKRPRHKLCSGQTLLCRSLDLKVPEWNQRTLTAGKLILEDTGYVPRRIVQTTRLGISKNRDAHLPYRFVDEAFAPHCTRNPLTRRNGREGKDYTIRELATGRCSVSTE
jgi:DNA-3-methyladenine glycosylase